MSDTKQRILDEALTLFAQKGYGDVYVGEIAEAVGIKAPSLYKHFKGKKEIFEAIKAEMSGRYLKTALGIGISGEDYSKDASIYKDISEDFLCEIGTGLFLFFLHDDHMSKFRKMLTLEQFKDKDMAKLYSALLYDGPISYQAQIFQTLISLGSFKEGDPQLMAVEFYSPIYMLLTECDRNPDHEKKALEIMDSHIRAFAAEYGRINR
ncbi:MAG: TetR/AcrR family transcriptional regulator [Clostridiales bacterium]|nr:TetR/AcrR family transcriptional regulator [Clostridiales bacterium]